MAKGCSGCSRRAKCKKICDRIEKLLPKPTSGRLRGEHSFDPGLLDTVLLSRKSRGVQKKAVHYDGNSERIGED